VNPFRYRIIVEWSDEDKAFVGRVPAFPFCSAHGGTPEEAAREATEAAEGILESLKAHGEPTPPEDVAADYSGQLRLRMPSSLHEKLSRLAAAEGVSLNQELVSVLAEHCGRKTVRRRPAVDASPAKGKLRRKAA
jgi:predicted RNase H-like HicB family nuclease